MNERVKEFLLNHYQYLWMTKGRYCLIKVGSGYVIEDRQDNRNLIIEEDDVYKLIIQKMIEEGCEIVEDPH